MKYINIVGGPGSGKSTLSRQIASQLGYKLIDLDSINWLENWQMIDELEFRKTVGSLIKENPNGWVVDGSYHHRLGNMVRDEIDTLIFLKIPLYVSVPRVVFRSARRIVNGEILWGTNKETVRGALTLLWWTVKYHYPRIKKTNRLALERPDVNYLVFRSNRAARHWLAKQIT